MVTRKEYAGDHTTLTVVRSSLPESDMRSASTIAALAAIADRPDAAPLYLAFNRNAAAHLAATLAADARPVFAADDDESNAPADETTSERNERLRRLATAHRSNRGRLAAGPARRNRNAPNN